MLGLGLHCQLALPAPKGNSVLVCSVILPLRSTASSPRPTPSTKAPITWCGGELLQWTVLGQGSGWMEQQGQRQLRLHICDLLARAPRPSCTLLTPGCVLPACPCEQGPCGVWRADGSHTRPALASVVSLVRAAASPEPETNLGCCGGSVLKHRGRASTFCCARAQVRR